MTTFSATSDRITVDVPAALGEGGHEIRLDGIPAGAFEVRADGSRSVVGEAIKTSATIAGTGWSCGGSLSNPPVEGISTGCSFGGTGVAGVLTVPALAAPAGSRLVVRLLHRMDFGMDGDGIVVMGQNGLQRRPLARVHMPTRIVHGRACDGGSCSDDPDFAGLSGVSLDVQPEGWYWDEFIVPEHSIGSSGFNLVIGASNRSGVAPASYALAAIEIAHTPIGVLNPNYSWTHSQVIGGDDCKFHSQTTGGFECVRDVADVSGHAWVWRSEGEGAVDFRVQVPASATQVRLRVRARAEFSKGAAANGGEGRIELCCGSSCSVPDPIEVTCREALHSGDDWVYAVPTYDGIIDDYDTEQTWSEYLFDISAAASGNCRVRFAASGSVGEGADGFLVDDAVVEYRH